ncbi:MAG: mandelate racemase/muconate lactonizing enzyme family protein [Beijerinckiaceae bacterium]
MSAPRTISPLRIDRVEIFLLDQERIGAGKLKAVIVRITAGDLAGFGELALAYGLGAKAGAAMIEEMARRFLVGADAFRTDAIFDTLYRLSLWAQGGGPVIYGAMSAIDIALHDLKARALGVPVYDLIGGRCHEAFPCYANAWFYEATSLEEHAEAARMVVNKGFSALKFDPLKRAPDGTPDRPKRELTPERLKFGVALTEAVRGAIGPDVGLWLDLHANLGPPSAIAFIRAIEALKPAYVEEPVDAMNVECMKRVRDGVDAPLSAGERLYLRAGFRPWVESQCLDLLQPDVGLAGGIAETRRIAAMAETYGLSIQPHNCASPLLTAASIQVAAACPNAGILEIFPFRKEAHYALLHDPLEMTIRDGVMPVPTGPGLGVTVDEGYLARFDKVVVER